tara:strand:+ start:468 stop:890 length:423 start_codon:yes stop_codon:yes gene_type:complete
LSSKFKTPLANKKDYLKEAELLIHGDREADYGDNLLNHRRIATMWNVILGKKLITPIEPEEVAACMIGLKVARLSEDTKKKDSWVDVVGYGALGGEMVSRVEAEAQSQKTTNKLSLTPEEEKALLEAVSETDEDADDSQA